MMPVEPEFLPGEDHTLLLLCDHASNVVPDGVDLGIGPDLLDKHIGVDIGAEALTRQLSRRLAVPAILATVSRLVIDLHREPDHPNLVPAESDGHAIPGNVGADRDERIARFHAPYHGAIAERVRTLSPRLLVAIHSFTPELEQGGAPRPWEVGVLHNRDDRAARHLLAALRQRDIVTGDNEPYSGRKLNATLNRHGEANGVASVSIEVRNDLIDSEEGVARWTDILIDVLGEMRNGLASEGSYAT